MLWRREQIGLWCEQCVADRIMLDCGKGGDALSNLEEKLLTWF